MCLQVATYAEEFELWHNFYFVLGNVKGFISFVWEYQSMTFICLGMSKHDIHLSGESKHSFYLSGNVKAFI